MGKWLLKFPINKWKVGCDAVWWKEFQKLKVTLCYIRGSIPLDYMRPCLYPLSAVPQQKTIIETWKIFLCKASGLQNIFVISRHSWGYTLHIISGNCKRSERTKLKMKGYSKKQIGIDQLGFSRKWWITCDSRHISLWLLLLFCGKRTTPYICW